MIGGIGDLSLPPRSAIPADIRAKGPEAEKSFRAVLGFERTLLLELAKSLAETAKPTGEEDQGLSAVSQSYRQMLPEAMADAVVANGGTGLAAQLYAANTAPGTR
jgi:Rod binding domain-containing protein